MIVQVFRVLVIVEQVTPKLLLLAMSLLMTMSMLHAQDSAADLQQPPMLSLNADRSFSQSGEYQLSWSPSPQDGEYDFVRVEQHTPYGDETQVSEHAVDGESVWLMDYTHGTRSLVARACRKNNDAVTCGPASSTVQVEVSAQALTVRPTYSAVEQPEPAQGLASGPLDFAPGIYQSNFARNNAWSLYWKNNLGRDEDDPLFGNIYDLVVLWVTYRDMAPPGQAPNLLPTYLIGVLQKNGSVWSGSLTRPRRNPDGSVSSAIVGNLNISMRQEGGRNLPTAMWRVNDPTFYRNGSISWVTDPLQWSPSQFGLPEDANPVDHYQGFWVPPLESPVHGQGIGLASVIIGAFEGQTVLFLDAAGEPAWAAGFRDGRPSNPAPTAMTEWCVNTSVAGDFPDGPDQDGLGSINVALGCTVAQIPTTSGNLGRQYLPLIPGPGSQARYWTNFVLPPESNRSGSVNIGTEFSPLPMNKAANFHMIRPTIAGSRQTSQCIKGVNGLCQLKLDWFSDGEYPQARAYLRNTVTNSLVFVASGWPSVEDFNHAIVNDGSYQYELWRDSNTGASGQRLAISRRFDVLINTCINKAS